MRADAVGAWGIELMVEAHKPRQCTEGDIEAEQVSTYLTRHPDFFERHPALLESLAIPHATGSAVSLIEHQVTRLKQRNRHLQQRLSALVDTAKENEARVLHLNRLARRLIEAHTLQDIVDGLAQCMREEFGVSALMIGLREAGVDDALPEQCAGVRRLRDEAALPQALNDLFRTGCSECGPLSDDLCDFLFPDSDEGLRSVALVPLDRAAEFGVLALASTEPQQFLPDMGTWFLEQLANLVAGAVQARLGEPLDG